MFDCLYIYAAASDDPIETRSQAALNLAIEHSWARGLRHPTFWWLYTGDFDSVPGDVYDDHGGREPVSFERGLSRHEISRIQALKAQGYSHAMIASLMRRSRTGVISILKRHKAA